MKTRKQLGKRMTQALLEAQTSWRPVPGPTCGCCGQEMGDKGDKALNFGSMVEDIAIIHGYYYITGPGMRWSCSGADNLLPVRAAVMTGKARFDDL